MDNILWLFSPAPRTMASRHTSTNSMVPASNFSGAEPLGAKPSISDSWANAEAEDLRWSGGSGAETHGKLWKNHGKTWENHGKTYGNKSMVTDATRGQTLTFWRKRKWFLSYLGMLMHSWFSFGHELEIWAAKMRSWSIESWADFSIFRTSLRVVQHLTPFGKLFSCICLRCLQNIEVIPFIKP